MIFCKRSIYLLSDSKRSGSDMDESREYPNPKNLGSFKSENLNREAPSKACTCICEFTFEEDVAACLVENIAGDLSLSEWHNVVYLGRVLIILGRERVLSNLGVIYQPHFFYYFSSVCFSHTANHYALEVTSSFCRHTGVTFRLDVCFPII